MPGYEAKFVHPLLKRHECPICLFAMRNPVQTGCGHLFCRECLEPVLRRRRPICPLDKEEIAIFPDNACCREILNLEVYCNFMTSGCTWTGPLKKLDSHLGSCEYREVQCTQCGQYIQQLGLQSHMQFQCPMRPQPCPHCSKEVPYQQMQAHLDKVCWEVLHLCPNGCDHDLKMRIPELEKHLSPKVGDCPLSEVECPYKAYGCSFVSLRKNIPIHIEQYMMYHAQLQADYFVELKQQANKNNAAAQHLMERITSLEMRMNAVERLQDALEQRVELLDDRRERHVDRYAGRIETVEDHTQKLTNTVTQMQKRVQIRDTIFNGLQEVISNLHYTNVIPQEAFFSSDQSKRCKRSPHSAIVGDNWRLLKCTSNPEVCCQLTGKQLYMMWRGPATSEVSGESKHSPATNTPAASPAVERDASTTSVSIPRRLGTTGKPSSRELMLCLYKTVAAEWSAIGTFIGVSRDQLRIIGERHLRDPQKCLLDMLDCWLDCTDPAPTWDDVASAVEFIGKQELAQEIRRKHCH